MGDLIDREKALKTIYNRYGSAYEWYLKNGISGKELNSALTSYAECHVAIRNLPSAESTEPKWIPVTEPPPKPDAYLVTYHDYGSDDGIREVDVLEYVEYSDGETQNVDYDWWGYEKVVDAWMQLPKPYEGGDAE